MKGFDCPSLASLWDLPGQRVGFSLISFWCRRSLTGSVKSVLRPGREPLGVSVVLASRAGPCGRPGWVPGGAGALLSPAA